jgi:hypothetical protein
MQDVVGETDGNRPLGRPRYKWEVNIKMGLQEVGWRGMNWIDLAQDRDRWWVLVNAVMKLWVAYNMGNFLTGCRHVSFSGRKLLYGVC